MDQQIESEKNPLYAQVPKKERTDEKPPKVTRDMKIVREFGKEKGVLVENDVSKHPTSSDTAAPSWLSLGDGRRLFADGTVTDKDDNILALPIEGWETQFHGRDTWMPE